MFPPAPGLLPCILVLRLCPGLHHILSVSPLSWKIPDSSIFPFVKVVLDKIITIYPTVDYIPVLKNQF